MPADPLLPIMKMPVAASSILRISLPLVGRTAHAGFPSPADDFLEDSVDLNKVLIANPAATYLWRVVGDCMVDVKIFHGDVVVVDRSLEAKHRSIVLAIVDGDPTLKRFERRGGEMFLRNENRSMLPFAVADGVEISIWGVVTATIRKL